jgi:hypothetical protein
MLLQEIIFMFLGDTESAVKIIRDHDGVDTKAKYVTMDKLRRLNPSIQSLQMLFTRFSELEKSSNVEAYEILFREVRCDPPMMIAKLMGYRSGELIRDLII